MFNLKDNQLSFTRGDTVAFNLSIDGYMFQPGDKVTFRIYKKSRLNQEPLMEVVTVAEVTTANLRITLSSEDTKFGEMINKPIEYWYEIELNDSQTVIGYDEEGPKILTLYPEGKLVEEEEKEPDIPVIGPGEGNLGYTDKEDIDNLFGEEIQESV